MGKLTSYLGPTITRDQGHQHGINLLSDRIPCPCSHLSNQALLGGGGRHIILPRHSPTSKSNQISRRSQTWRASKWRKSARYDSLSSGSGGGPSQEKDSSGHGDHWPGGHENALPTAPQILSAIWEDVVYVQTREGKEFPDVLL